MYRERSKSHNTGILYASILLGRQKVHVIAEMAISIDILIPGRDPGDKRTVAFGASENSRPIGYLRSL